MIENWIKQPSLTQLLIVAFIWLVGIIMSLLVISNLLTKNIIQSNNELLITYMVLSTFVLLRLTHNYVRSRK